MSIFNPEYLNAIAEALKGNGAVIKNSTVYNKSIVVGHRDVPGCIMVSDLTDEGDEENNFFISYYKNHKDIKDDVTMVFDGQPTNASSIKELTDIIKKILVEESKA